MTDTLFFIDEDEVLAHHGVKGMKWGVRKQRAASGGAGSTKKRKGLSRKQKAAIAGVLGTAAAAGAGYYLHKSGKGKKIAALAKKHGASARDFAKGKGRNLGAQARVKQAQAKRFAKVQSANAKGAAEKLKTTKAGKYAEATRLAANAAAFKTGNAVKGAGYKAKNQAWKAGNKARKGAEGGVKSAAGMAKSVAGAAKSKVGKKAPGKALSTHIVQPGKGVGYRKLATTGTKVMGGKGDAAKKLAKVAAAGVGVQAGVNVAGAAGARALNKKLNGGKKSGTSKKRRR